MIHELKIGKPFADAIVYGRKTFEVRKNDRGFNAGDEVEFVCMDGMVKALFHDINKKKYRITYVLSGWGLTDGYVAFGIEEVESSKMQTSQDSDNRLKNGGSETQTHEEPDSSARIISDHTRDVCSIIKSMGVSIPNDFAIANRKYIDRIERLVSKQ